MAAVDGGWGDSEFIDAGGLGVHVRTLGDPEAPPALLLHGFPQDSWMWRHQAPVLSETHRVIAPDTWWVRAHREDQNPRDAIRARQRPGRAA